MLQSIQPDLILVDVNLAEWTGNELVNGIRSQQAGRQTPIIALMAADEALVKDTISQPILVTKVAGLELGKVTHLIHYFMGLPN